MNPIQFLLAEPVWPLGLSDEVNLRIGFSAQVPKSNKCFISIASSCNYQLFVNDEFIACGPARAGHGYFRVDEIDIGHCISNSENTVSILLWSYRIDNYCIPNQAPFLTAEIVQDSEVTAATGIKGFRAYALHDYMRYVQRYTFQRTFVESYVLDPQSRAWMSTAEHMHPLEIEITNTKQYIARNVLYPEYEKLFPHDYITKGKFTIEPPKSYKQAWHLKIDNDNFFQFKKDKLDEDINEIIQDIRCDTQNTLSEYIDTSNERSQIKQNSLFLNSSEYALFSFPIESTGMLSFRAKCDTACEFLIVYDEMLTNGLPEPMRIHGLWANKYRLEAGEYDLMFFEPVSMKYMNFIMQKGSCKFEDVHIVEYKHPKINKTINTKDNDLLQIFDAAIETFRQNSLDIFMDCPSRERAGWLCDSFFSARVEHCLTGQSLVEKNFLSNFLMPDKFSKLPKGMFPMCYPADHADGRFIPNWAMWLVLQLYEYKNRSDDTHMVQAFKEKIYDLLHYFEGFINSYGLLENLESWVFVEWSAANDYVQNVNFPTNMLYALVLERVAELYNDTEKFAQAQSIRQSIRELSFDGSFFRDRMVYKNGVLEVTEDCTEVCQYYAFFTKTADINSHPALWDKLVQDFGPDRLSMQKYMNVQPANVFIGTYLRLELLSKQGLHKQLLDECKDFFLYMAQRTGTLWEMKSDSASLNHGFASHIAVWIIEALEAK